MGGGGEEEEKGETLIYCSADIDSEQRNTDVDEYDSESEIDMELRQEEDLVNLRFYVGKDGETLSSNKTIALASKIKSKHIVKSFPGPKGQAH